MSSFDGIFCLPILEKGEYKMVSVRKRGKVYEYQFETVTTDPAHIFTQEEIERILDTCKDLKK